MKCMMRLHMLCGQVAMLDEETGELVNVAWNMATERRTSFVPICRGRCCWGSKLPGGNLADGLGHPHPSWERSPGPGRSA